MKQKLRRSTLFGNQLRLMRYKAGLTQEQVTIKLQLRGLNVTRSIYSQMEGGIYNIRLEELAALVEIFGIDYNTLFDL